MISLVIGLRCDMVFDRYTFRLRMYFGNFKLLHSMLLSLTSNTSLSLLFQSNSIGGNHCNPSLINTNTHHFASLLPAPWIFYYFFTTFHSIFVTFIYFSVSFLFIFLAFLFDCFLNIFLFLNTFLGLYACV